MNTDMPHNIPDFDSDDEMREWFESANLAEYDLDQALDVLVAASVQLTVGDGPPAGSDTVGATGTLREPVRLVGA